MCAWYNTVPWVFRHWNSCASVLTSSSSPCVPVSMHQCAEWYAQRSHEERKNNLHTHTPAETKNNHTSKWYLWDVRGAFIESVDECDWMRTRDRDVWRQHQTKNQRRYIYITKWLYLLIHISPESVCFFCWILRYVFHFIRLFFIVFSPSHFESSRFFCTGCCSSYSTQFCVHIEKGSRIHGGVL